MVAGGIGGGGDGRQHRVGEGQAVGRGPHPGLVGRDGSPGALQLNLPSYSGFVMPKLTPVMTNGQITDVTISYPMDLTQQMLEYSGVRK